jgi:hypothetical protein
MSIQRVLSAVVAAALGAALMLALPGFSPVGSAAPVAKAEPQSAPRVDTCAEQAWPYYDASCLRSHGTTAQPAEEARVVRIVRPDRLTR